MKWFIGIFSVLFLMLQYNMWFGPGSMAEVHHLRAAIAAQKQHNAGLFERNAALIAEVDDLKRGVDAIEERARVELGMIKPNETFFQIINE